MNDLKGVVGFVEDKWFLKTIHNDQLYIKETNDDKLVKKLKHYKVFSNINYISLAQVVMKYSKYFAYNEAKLYKGYEENIINIFQGFKYNEYTTEDFAILEPLLNHIKTIVCNNDDKNMIIS